MRCFHGVLASVLASSWSASSWPAAKTKVGLGSRDSRGKIGISPFDTDKKYLDCVTCFSWSQTKQFFLMQFFALLKGFFPGALLIFSHHDKHKTKSAWSTSCHCDLRNQLWIWGSKIYSDPKHLGMLSFLIMGLPNLSNPNPKVFHSQTVKIK